MSSGQQRTAVWKSLHVQVLAAIVLGVLVGYADPELGARMKPLGDAFIKLIKMMIAPIIFCSVVTGIASAGDVKKVGRVGVKALLYFQVLTVFSLFIGLFVVNMVKPGAGMNVDPAALDASTIAGYASSAQSHKTLGDFVLDIIPKTVFDAFTQGEILQVLLFSVLFGFALAGMKEKGRPLTEMIVRVSHVLFKIIKIIMYAAPIGAFGAMAFSVGKYGVGSLRQLGALVACFYATCAIFIVVVLGAVTKICGINLFSFLRYIQDEILIVMGTSSSETALPRLLKKMEVLGCSGSVAGLVIPTGYSFNLDGTAIYLSMAAIFLAQATNIHLSLAKQLSILAVLLITSKGAAGVTGSGFIVLAATLSSVSDIPVAALSLLLGVDRFMSQARALTNFIGNGVATIVIAKWEGEFDAAKAERALAGDFRKEDFEDL
jgi:aerobic C4-dicarboxylate transport protein